MVSRTNALVLVCAGALAACGGGGDDQVVVVDAAIDAPIDAAIDAAPPVCAPPSMMCGAECVNVTSSEAFCGNCQTACSGGQVCTNSTCGCAAGLTIPASPTFLLEQVNGNTLPGATIGFGAYFGATIDALVVGRVTADTAVNSPHTLTGANLGTPPFAAFGYDIDTASMLPAAAYYATAGTLTFTKICLEDTATGQQPGFSGTLSEAVFSAVDSITNPVLVPGGCHFPETGTLGTVTFTFGDVSCQ